MNRLIPLALATGLAAAPGHAAEVQISATGPVIELSVSEQIDAEPDVVVVANGWTSTKSGEATDRFEELTKVTYKGYIGIKESRESNPSPTIF